MDVERGAFCGRVERRVRRRQRAERPLACRRTGRSRQARRGPPKSRPARVITAAHRVEGHQLARGGEETAAVCPCSICAGAASSNRSPWHANRVSGKRPRRAPGNGFPDARDERPQTTSGRASFLTETVNGPTRLLRTAENPGCSAETRKIRVARDCVVGLEGLEPATTPLVAVTAQTEASP